MDFRRTIADSKQQMVRYRGRKGATNQQEFLIAKSRYVALLHQSEVFWKQRSKQFWLASGDMNTKYFHFMDSTKQKKNQILILKGNIGVWKYQENGMYGVILEYFQSLYMLEGCKQGSCLNAIGQMIIVANNETLMAPYSELEITEALLFSMHPDKSPSPDGMNLAFFQKYWHIVGSEVSSACLSILNHDIMPDGFNDTHRVLIPKKQPVESMGDLRPISQCNDIYKIVAKVLANRL